MLPTCFCPPNTVSSDCSLKCLPSSLWPISFSGFYIIPHSPWGLNYHLTHFLPLLLSPLLLLLLSAGSLTLSTTISSENSGCVDCEILNPGPPSAKMGSEHVLGGNTVMLCHRHTCHRLLHGFFSQDHTSKTKLWHYIEVFLEWYPCYYTSTLITSHKGDITMSGLKFPPNNF